MRLDGVAIMRAYLSLANIAMYTSGLMRDKARALVGIGEYKQANACIAEADRLQNRAAAFTNCAATNFTE